MYEQCLVSLRPWCTCIVTQGTVMDVKTLSKVQKERESERDRCNCETILCLHGHAQVCDSEDRSHLLCGQLGVRNPEAIDNNTVKGRSVGLCVYKSNKSQVKQIRSGEQHAKSVNKNTGSHNQNLSFVDKCLRGITNTSKPIILAKAAHVCFLHGWKTLMMISSPWFLLPLSIIFCVTLSIMFCCFKTSPGQWG